MPGAEAGREQSYQWLLRSLGAHLDTEASGRITLTETPDGFAIRFQGLTTTQEPVVVQLRRDALVEQLRALRGSTRSTARTHQGIWRNFPNGHQDFFRALGFELDEARAQDVLLDELENELILTYRYPDPQSGGWGKRMIILGIADIEAILNAAFERRGASAAPE